ncbi:MAG: hypothetical protein C0432_02980 [Candidatus Puniceispirillum sp.]|nr:hypothetical protein [Candidatus Pelagibacter sp.]MBA4283240.1 hypothetical protein [Candidatus Puniceispirillum sp.]
MLKKTIYTIFLCANLVASSLFAQDLNSYLQNTEETIISNCRLGNSFNSKQDKVSSLMQNSSTENTEFQSAIIVWDEQTPAEILSTLFWIRDKKVQYRVNHSNYVQNLNDEFFRYGVEIDRSCIKSLTTHKYDSGDRLFFVPNKNVKCHDGHYICMTVKQFSDSFFKMNMSFDEFNSKIFQFQCLGEILRGHDTNSYISIHEDDFSNFPIAVSFVMATKLIQATNSEEEMNKFWQEDGAYHIFRGVKNPYDFDLSSSATKREDRFQNLLNAYCKQFGLNLNNPFLIAKTIEKDAEEIFGYTDYLSDLSNIFGNM